LINTKVAFLEGRFLSS